MRIPARSVLDRSEHGGTISAGGAPRPPYARFLQKITVDCGAFLRYQCNAILCKHFARWIYGVSRSETGGGADWQKPVNNSSSHEDKPHCFYGGDCGERLIDTSELHRVFPILASATNESNDASNGQRNDTQLTDLRAQLDIERVKNLMLQERLAAVAADKDDLREDRNRWRTQAEQSQLFLADLREKTQAQAVEATAPRRGWWWLRRKT